MDIDDAASQRLIRFWKAFKYSDFYPIEVSVRHLHFRRRLCAFLAERGDHEIQCDQVVAQSQGMDQATLQGCGEEDGQCQRLASGRYTERDSPTHVGVFCLLLFF